MYMLWGSATVERVGHGNPLQCSCLENPVDRGAWRVTGSQRVGHNLRDSVQTQGLGGRAVSV